MASVKLPLSELAVNPITIRINMERVIELARLAVLCSPTSVIDLCGRVRFCQICEVWAADELD
jgi:hypothetical protein